MIEIEGLARKIAFKATGWRVNAKTKNPDLRISGRKLNPHRRSRAIRRKFLRCVQKTRAGQRDIRAGGPSQQGRRSARRPGVSHFSGPERPTALLLCCSRRRGSSHFATASRRSPHTSIEERSEAVAAHSRLIAWTHGDASSDQRADEYIFST